MDKPKDFKINEEQAELMADYKTMLCDFIEQVGGARPQSND